MDILQETVTMPSYAKNAPQFSVITDASSMKMSCWSAQGGYMKGLELSERFYRDHGEPMLREFPELLPLISAGLVGGGSECLGFDDELSRDHDFEAGFCIFIPDEDRIDSRSAFALERAYGIHTRRPRSR